MPSRDIFAHINLIFPHWSIVYANYIPQQWCKDPPTDSRKVDSAVSEFYFEGGLTAFVAYLNRSRNALHEIVTADSIRDNITVELALAWTDSFHENTLCFTNNIPQRDAERIWLAFAGDDTWSTITLRKWHRKARKSPAYWRRSERVSLRLYGESSRSKIFFAKPKIN